MTEEKEIHFPIERLNILYAQKKYVQVENIEKRKRYEQEYQKLKERYYQEVSTRYALQVNEERRREFIHNWRLKAWTIEEMLSNHSDTEETYTVIYLIIIPFLLFIFLSLAQSQ